MERIFDSHNFTRVSIKCLRMIYAQNAPFTMYLNYSIISHHDILQLGEE